MDEQIGRPEGQLIAPGRVWPDRPLVEAADHDRPGQGHANPLSQGPGRGTRVGAEVDMGMPVFDDGRVPAGFSVAHRSR